MYPLRFTPAGPVETHVSTDPDPDEDLTVAPRPSARHLANCSTVPRIARDDRCRFRSAGLSPASSLAHVRPPARSASAHSFCATKTREVRV